MRTLTKDTAAVANDVTESKVESSQHFWQQAFCNLARARHGVALPRIFHSKIGSYSLQAVYCTRSEEGTIKAP
jgi:hypothetical protein